MCCARLSPPGDAGIDGEVPNGAAEAEAVDQVQGDRHIDGIDGYHLIVDFRIIHVAVGEIDLDASTL